MATTVVEKLSPTRVKLAISVPPEELRPAIQHAYGQIAEQVNIPGFRKGKVPPPIIDQRVGRAAVLEHAVNEGIDTFFREAVVEQSLRPLGRPSADITEWPNATDFSGDLQIAIEVDVRPEIALPPLDSFTVSVAPIQVTDDDVAKQLDELRARFGTLISVDRPAAVGDFVQLDLTATIDGEQVDAANGISYEIGSGELLEGVDEALVSLTAGESTTFESTLLGGEHEGKKAEIAVTVLQVKERELPDLDDEFAQMASEFDTLDDLRADVTEQVQQQKRFAQINEARDKIAESLLAAVDVPVPASVLEEEVQRHLENENRLGDEEHRAEVTEQSEKAFRTQLLFDAVAEAEHVQVSQDEFANYLIQSAQQYNMQPQEFVQVLQENNQLSSVMGEVARSKAIALVLGKVSVVDTDGNLVDVSDFVPSEPEPADEAATEAEAAAAEDIEPVADAPVATEPVNDDAANGEPAAKPAKKSRAKAKAAAES